MDKTNQVKMHSPYSGVRKVVRIIAIILGCILALLITLVLCLPIVLLAVRVAANSSPRAARSPGWKIVLSSTREMALYLRQRFDKDKIYVLGESWGSALGIMTVQRHPELFHAFIGTGQMVAFLETDLICYDFAMRLAQERGDTQKVEQLKRQGPPPYYTSDVAMKSATYLMETFNRVF